MFTIDDFAKRYDHTLTKIKSHWCAPNTMDYLSIPVRVNRQEFHDLCTQDSRIFTERKVHGVPIIVSSGDFK